MKTIATVGLLALVAAAAGCGVQNRSSVEITGPLHWKISAGSGGSAATCSVDTGTHDDSGIMDVNYKVYTYYQPFEVTNNMLSNTDTTNTNRLNTADFDVQKVVATYLGTSDAATSALANLSTEIPVAATIPAAGGKLQGPLPLITASVGKSIAAALSPTKDAPQTVIVRWHLEGVRKDGIAVSTGDYQFPVELCAGCLACPSGTTASGCAAGQDPVICQ